MPDPPPTLPAWATRLIADLDENDRRAQEIAGDLTLAQLNWRASPETWSVGQCLEHLCNANVVYLPPIEKSLEARPSSPVAEITPGWFGRWFIQSYIEPSAQTRKRRAPRKIAPVRDVGADVLARLLDSNVVARDLIRRAAAYDVNRIRFVNPFVPVIRFTVGTGLEIVARHQRRHLLQAEGVRRDAGFPLHSHGRSASLP